MGRVWQGVLYICVGFVLGGGLLCAACKGDAVSMVGQAWGEDHEWVTVPPIRSQVEVVITAANPDGSVEAVITVKEVDSSNAAAFWDKNGDGVRNGDEPLAQDGSPVTVTVPDGITGGVIMVKDFLGQWQPKELDFFEDFD